MKKIKVVPPKKFLSAVAILAIESINQMKDKADKWQQELSDWRQSHPTDERKRTDLFEIEFPENTDGYLYPDFLLNNYTFSVSVIYGTKVRFKKLRCYLIVSLGRNAHVNKIEPEFSLHIKVSVENLGDATEAFPRIMNFDWDAGFAYFNWISDDEQKKKGIGLYSPFMGTLGIALIFNDDDINKSVIAALEDCLKEINQKFTSAQKTLHYVSEESLNKKRLNVIREVHQ